MPHTVPASPGHSVTILSRGKRPLVLPIVAWSVTYTDRDVSPTEVVPLFPHGDHDVALINLPNGFYEPFDELLFSNIEDAIDHYEVK